MTNNLYGYQTLPDDTEKQHKLCRGLLLEKIGRGTSALKQSDFSRYLSAPTLCSQQSSSVSIELDSRGISNCSSDKSLSCAAQAGHEAIAATTTGTISVAAPAYAASGTTCHLKTAVPGRWGTGLFYASVA